MKNERLFRVTEIDSTGNAVGFEEYLNSLSPRENMITSCIMHHHIGNVLDKRMREKYSKEIKGMEGQRLMFFIGDTTFISENLRQ